MSTFHDAYVGAANETVYGTLVAPTIFPEFLSENITGAYERIESEGLRAGKTVQRADRFATNPKGAAGDLSLEVFDNGLEFFLKHMLGNVTSAAPVGGFITHTAKLGDLKGSSFSLKVGRVDTGGTINHFDYLGGKVASWEFSNSVDGILQLSNSLDFAKEGLAATPAVPNYLANAQLLTFLGGQVTIGGTEVFVSEVSVSGENGLKTDRYGLRGGANSLKREPVTEGLREITFSLTCEFEGMAHLNRVASATAAGSLAAIVGQWDSPQGGQLKLDMPVGRFDEAPVTVESAGVLTQTVTGKVLLDPAGTDAITATYKAKQ